MRRSAYLVLVVLVCHVGVATAQDPQTHDSIAQRVQHLMSIEVGFEQMVPPGMSIEAKEVSRKGKSGGAACCAISHLRKGSSPRHRFQSPELATKC